MDGKGRWVDNVFVERVWRSVKYEAVYLKAYESSQEAARQLAQYFQFGDYLVNIRQWFWHAFAQTTKGDTKRQLGVNY